MAFTSLRTHSPKSGAFALLLTQCTTIAAWLNSREGWLTSVCLAPPPLDLGDASDLWQAVVTWDEPSSSQGVPKSDSEELPVPDVPAGDWPNMGLEMHGLSMDEEDVLCLDALLINGPRLNNLMQKTKPKKHQLWSQTFLSTCPTSHLPACSKDLLPGLGNNQ